VDVQAAERRVALEHLQRRLLVEAPLELLGAAVLDGVGARLAREQARAGERGEHDAHGAQGCQMRAPSCVPAGAAPAATRRWPGYGARPGAPEVAAEAAPTGGRETSHRHLLTSIAIKRYDFPV